jgi:hypothetical protein
MVGKTLSNNIKVETIELILFGTFILGCAFAWYFMWVVPRTEFLHAVMDCMGELGDRSEAGYRICVDRVSG